MSLQPDDVWEMWALWHWRSGIVGDVYGRRRDVKRGTVGTVFIDSADYDRNVGKGRPYRIVKVDVSRAKP